MQPEGVAYVGQARVLPSPVALPEFVGTVVCRGTNLDYGTGDK